MGRINAQFVEVISGNHQLIITIKPAQDVSKFNGKGGFFRDTIRLDICDGLILITVISPSGSLYLEALRELFAGESVNDWFDQYGKLTSNAAKLATKLSKQQLQIIERTPSLMQLS